MSRKKEKVIYPLLCLKGKEREVLLRPMVPCIVVQILPPTWAVQRISNYGCTGHGMLLHAPLFIIISAHIYMYMCVCMCVLPKPLQLKGSLKWGYIRRLMTCVFMRLRRRGVYSKLIAFSSCNAVKEHIHTHFLMVDTMTTLQNKEKTCHDPPVRQPSSII